jgi:uncharacterized tellurite resistance protein B-like protein
VHEPLGISARFREAFLGSPNQLGFSLTTLLAWIAVCDNEVVETERQFIAGIAGAGSRPIDSASAIEAAQWATAEDLQLACEVVRHVTPEKRRLVLDMAIGVAMADGTLRPMENHILRCLADMLELGERGIDASFLEATGKPFPRPADMSSVEYWKESAQQNQSESQETPRKRTDTDVRRTRALATLGLEESASAQEIVQAYRRLAKVHHPDRFESLGAESVRAATQTFQRIQAAYEHLRA